MAAFLRAATPPKLDVWGFSSICLLGVHLPGSAKLGRQLWMHKILIWNDLIPLQIPTNNVSQPWFIMGLLPSLLFWRVLSARVLDPVYEQPCWWRSHSGHIPSKPFRDWRCCASRPVTSGCQRVEVRGILGLRGSRGGGGSLQVRLLTHAINARDVRRAPPALRLTCRPP